MYGFLGFCDIIILTERGSVEELGQIQFGEWMSSVHGHKYMVVRAVALENNGSKLVLRALWNSLRLLRERYGEKRFAFRKFECLKSSNNIQWYLVLGLIKIALKGCDCRLVLSVGQSTISSADTKTSPSRSTDVVRGFKNVTEAM